MPLVQQEATPIPEGKGVPARRPAAASAATGQPAYSPENSAQISAATRASWRGEDADKGRRQSANIEAAVLFSELVKFGLKAICFCSVRKICELVLDYRRPPPYVTFGSA